MYFCWISCDDCSETDSTTATLECTWVLFKGVFHLEKVAGVPSPRRKPVKAARLFPSRGPPVMLPFCSRPPPGVHLTYLSFTHNAQPVRDLLPRRNGFSLRDRLTCNLVRCCYQLLLVSLLVFRFRFLGFQSKGPDIKGRKEARLQSTKRKPIVEKSSVLYFVWSHCGILSGIYSDILMINVHLIWQSSWNILRRIICHGIWHFLGPSIWHKFRHFIWHIYIYLTFFCNQFSHFIRHSIWHFSGILSDIPISDVHTFTHTHTSIQIYDIYIYISWHPIWPIWRSLGHLTWRSTVLGISLWHMAFYLAFFLTSYLASLLNFYLRQLPVYLAFYAA